MERLIQACASLLAMPKDPDGWTWLSGFARLREALLPAFGCTGLLAALALPASQTQGARTSYRVYAEAARRTHECALLDLDRPDPLLDAASASQDATCVEDFPAALGDLPPDSRPPTAQLLVDRGARPLFIIPIGGAPDGGEHDVAAVLILYDGCVRYFQTEHKELAERLAPAARSVLVNTYLRSQQRLRELHTRILHDVSTHALVDPPTPGRLYQQVCDLLHEHLGFDLVSVYRVEWADQQIRPQAHAGRARGEDSATGRRSVNTGILGHVARTGNPYVGNDAIADPLCSEALERDRHVRHLRTRDLESGSGCVRPFAR